MNDDLIRTIGEMRRPLGLIDTFRPNQKQWLFCNAGRETYEQEAPHEILLSGPNQIGGKTYTLRYMIAVHSTGLYPPEWEGHRFTRPPDLAIAGETADATRDQITAHLFGFDGHENWIPADCFKIDECIWENQKKGLLSIGYVDWHDPHGRKKGKTILRAFGYSQGWRTIAGQTLNGIFLNELPKDDIYNEMRARINATYGYIWMVCCPIEGDVATYLMFERCTNGTMLLIPYTIHDCEHLSEEDYQWNLKRWEHHPEAEARLYGRPCRGTGLVYWVDRDRIVEPPFPYNAEMRQIIGIDLPHGTGHFAAVKLVIDHNNTVHVVDEVKLSNKDIGVYASRLRMMGGTKIPVAWPHDGGIGFGETTASGTIAERYREYGINMLRDPAFVYTPEGKKTKNRIVAIEEIQERLSAGTIQISQNCRELLDEMRIYRHDKGKIKGNQDDHLIDALHKAMMMLREAKVPGLANQTLRLMAQQRNTSEYDFFGG